MRKPVNWRRSGTPLFKVADSGASMYLRAYITSEQLSQGETGTDKVTVYSDYGNSEVQKAYPGVVTWISDRSEFTPKTILDEE